MKRFSWLYLVNGLLVGGVAFGILTYLGVVGAVVYLGVILGVTQERINRFIELNKGADPITKPDMPYTSWRADNMVRIQERNAAWAVHALHRKEGKDFVGDDRVMRFLDEHYPFDEVSK